MAFSTIAASDVDSDSPITDTLMNTIRTNFDDHEGRLSTVENDSLGSFLAGDVLNNSLDIARVKQNASYEKRKEFTLGRGGTIRIKFDLESESALAFGRIYRNGVAVGTEQTETSSYQTFSEDISGWSQGDTLELWAKTNDPSREVRVRNFRLYTAPPEITQPTHDAI